MPRTRLLASVVDVPSLSMSFAMSGLASSFFSIASILVLSAGSRRATLVILVHLLMQVGNPHTNHQTLSSGWKIGNVGAVIGAGIIGILSVMVVRYLTLVLQMFTRA
ncbi:hypothetical protein FRC0534_02284 [Corynebacterium diphtheriae]|nr:hypothetical protein FRC0534_02284 [Corynebacterium diphtheriae]